MWEPVWIINLQAVVDCGVLLINAIRDGTQEAKGDTARRPRWVFQSGKFDILGCGESGRRR